MYKRAFKVPFLNASCDISTPAANAKYTWRIRRQENTFRKILGIFEEINVLYDQQFAEFGDLSLKLVIAFCFVIAANVVFIAFFTIKALINHIQTLKYKLVCCTMGLSLPSTSCKTLFKYFKAIELKLKSFEGKICAPNAMRAPTCAQVVCKCVRMYIYIYINKYAYIHTYIHKYIYQVFHHSLRALKVCN